MSSRLILYPVLVQVFLTMTVYVLLNFAKLRALRRGEVNLARRALHEDAWPDSVIKINNNIRNQFEVPVLFYVLCFAYAVLDAVTLPVLVLAWLFAGSRIVHACVHVGPNIVPWRRRAFMLGCVAVVAMTLLAAYELLRR
jgi:hypothetical protein